MGGNIFKGKTKPIKKENIEPTIKKYFEELKKVFPDKAYIFDKEYFKYVGSVGKKEVSGDIDFAIDLHQITDVRFSNTSMAQWNLYSDKVREQFEKYKKRARTATDSELMTRAIMKGIVDEINLKSDNIYCDEKKIGSGGIFTLFPQYTPEGEKLDYGVQIDWLVGNIEWLTFSYYSESYQGNVKGLHRTQLMLAMFNHLGLSFSHVKGVVNLETREVLATNPKEAIKILEEGYNVELSEDTMNNYFNLINVVNNLPKEDKDSILKIYFKILDVTRADIPLDLQDEWKKRKEELSLHGKFLPEESLLREA